MSEVIELLNVDGFLVSEVPFSVLGQMGGANSGLLLFLSQLCRSLSDVSLSLIFEEACGSLAADRRDCCLYLYLSF